MMQFSTDGRRSYAVSVYNREVREAVKQNRDHTRFGDHWADIQFQDVMATDEAEARRLAAKRYPADQGFVVEELVPSLI